MLRLNTFVIESQHTHTENFGDAAALFTEATRASESIRFLKVGAACAWVMKEEYVNMSTQLTQVKTYKAAYFWENMAGLQL